jgi:hypothetical protein
MVILKFYQSQGLDSTLLKRKLESIKKKAVEIYDIELCYYIESESPLNKEEISLIKWILSSPFKSNQLLDASTFKDNESVIEIGPK